MNEEDIWLATDDPDHLISPAHLRETRRKLALLAAGISRQWVWLPTNCVAVIEAVERYAEGAEENVEAMTRAMVRESILGEAFERLPNATAHALTLLGYSANSGLNAIVQQSRQVEASRNHELKGPRGPLPGVAVIAHLMRDIFGNPFRPVAFAPEWRTDTATAIARQMYESRDFGATPILADALQDAGCDNADILSHCRDEGATHVRGCWVCDLVLGKE